VSKIEPRWVGRAADPAPPEPNPQPSDEHRSDPAWDKLLIVVGVIVVVVALLIVPGILNRGGKNPIAAAAEATQDAPGVRITFSGGAQGAVSMNMSGKAVLNGETDRASIEMTATGSTASGMQDFTFNEIVADGDIYFHSPQLGQVFGGTAQWLLMRSEVFGDLLQGDTAAGFSGSPTQQLDALEKASDQVTQVGREQVNGVETTHYRAVLDIDKVIGDLKSKLSGEFGDLLEQSMKDVSSPTVDVWIDSNGLLRRETSTSTMGSLGTFTMTMDFSDYGIHPNIAVPPSSEVQDVTPLLQRALDEASG
jgi:hypothetical protein